MTELSFKALSQRNRTIFFAKRELPNEETAEIRLIHDSRKEKPEHAIEVTRFSEKEPSASRKTIKYFLRTGHSSGGQYYFEEKGKGIPRTSEYCPPEHEEAERLRRLLSEATNFSLERGSTIFQTEWKELISLIKREDLPEKTNPEVTKSGLRIAIHGPLDEREVHHRHALDLIQALRRQRFANDVHVEVQWKNDGQTIQFTVRPPRMKDRFGFWKRKMDAIIRKALENTASSSFRAQYALATPEKTQFSRLIRGEKIKAIPEDLEHIIIQFIAHPREIIPRRSA